MATLDEFIPQQHAFNTRLAAALAGFAGDVTTLNLKIEELTASLGQLTPAQQAALDELVAAGEALATNAEAIDALTPPAVPNP